MSEATIIERIGKLLVQAERTSNDAEADAFFAKAQQLASTYSVELEIARQSVTNKELLESPTHKRIEIADPKAQLRPVFCELFMAIGGAQDLEFTIAHNSTYVNAYGFPSDIRIAEAMYAHVVHQMIEEARAFIAKGEWRDEKDFRYDRRSGSYVMKPVNARVVKRQFYEAFTSRIRGRLREAKRAAEAEKVTVTDAVTSETTETTGALVLVRKKDAVRVYYNTNNNARGTWGGNRNTYTSASGQRGGAEAGDRARLGGQQALPGSKKAIQ